MCTRGPFFLKNCYNCLNQVKTRKGIIHFTSSFQVTSAATPEKVHFKKVPVCCVYLNRSSY